MLNSIHSICYQSVNSALQGRISPSVNVSVSGNPLIMINVQVYYSPHTELCERPPPPPPIEIWPGLGTSSFDYPPPPPRVSGNLYICGDEFLYPTWIPSRWSRLGSLISLVLRDRLFTSVVWSQVVYKCCLIPIWCPSYGSRFHLFIYIHRGFCRKKNKQESIPVGCPPPAFLIRGGLPTEPPPWTETPPEGTWDQGQRPPEGIWDQTARQGVTSYRDPPDRMTDTYKNITLSRILFAGGKYV